MNLLQMLILQAGLLSESTRNLIPVWLDLTYLKISAPTFLKIYYSKIGKIDKNSFI